jgi:predicted nucleic acid-binding protein
MENPGTPQATRGGFAVILLDTSFTSEAAHWYAQRLQRREPLGRSMATADALIAATALAQGASLATRDGADFADIGLELINPWYSQRTSTPSNS